MRQDIIDDNEKNRTILTVSGYIRSAAEVAEHLKRRFQTEAFQASHMEKTIKQVIVQYTETSEIKRTEYDYDKMPGMKKTFLFMPIREGVVLERKFACWCQA